MARNVLTTSMCCTRYVEAESVLGEPLPPFYVCNWSSFALFGLISVSMPRRVIVVPPFQVLAAGSNGWTDKTAGLGCETDASSDLPLSSIV